MYSKKRKSGVGDVDEVVPLATGPPPASRARRPVARVRLDAEARRVGRDAERGRERIRSHRCDHRGAERRAEVLHPPAHRAAVDVRAVASEAVLLAIERQAVPHLVHRDVREHRRRGEAPREQLGRQRRGLDVRFAAGVERPVLHPLDDDHVRAAALVAELVARLDPDALGLALSDELLEQLVGHLDRLPWQLRLGEVAPASTPALTAHRSVVLVVFRYFARELLELLRQLLELELKLARVDPLGRRDEQPALHEQQLLQQQLVGSPQPIPLRLQRLGARLEPGQRRVSLGQRRALLGQRRALLGQRRVALGELGEEVRDDLSLRPFFAFGARERHRDDGINTSRSRCGTQSSIVAQ